MADMIRGRASSGDPPILALDDVSIHVRTDVGQRLKIVEHISLSIEPGRFFGLVGESGSGKTMIARAVMRLLPEDVIEIGGSISLCGEAIAAVPEARMRKLRGHSMSMIFQEPMSSLNPLMTVERQLGEAMDAHASVTRDEKRASILKLLTDVQFRHPAEVMQQYPHELSGGMRQRVMIAMALINSPKLLIADEPTTALDVTIQREVLEIIGGLSRAYDLAVLFISHDVSLVYEYADDIAVLYGGVLMEQGPARQIIDRPMHPYTKGLLDCVPRRRKGSVRQHGIDGSVPSVGNWFAGCRFRDRCGLARDACAADPVPVNRTKRRLVRCIAPLEPPEGAP